MRMGDRQGAGVESEALDAFWRRSVLFVTDDRASLVGKVDPDLMFSAGE